MVSAIKADKKYFGIRKLHVKNVSETTQEISTTKSILTTAYLEIKRWKKQLTSNGTWWQSLNGTPKVLFVNFMN